MSDETGTKRKYELRKRAEDVARTRLRITEAAVELHGSVGPARTTISAVAERAGVQRHTLYRHFPTEEDLYAACSGHWTAANPLPDIARRQAGAEPRESARAALAELYEYYERAGTMLEKVYRDAPLVAALEPGVAALEGYLDESARALADGWQAPAGRRPLVIATARHAVALTTWRSLVRQAGLRDEDAAELMVSLIECAARDSSRSVDTIPRSGDTRSP